jgi:hypothetical protein
MALVTRGEDYQITWDNVPVEKLSRAQLLTALKQCEARRVIPSTLSMSQLESWVRPQLILLLKTVGYKQLLVKVQKMEEDLRRNPRAPEDHEHQDSLGRQSFMTDIMVLGKPLSQLSRVEMAKALTFVALQDMGLEESMDELEASGDWMHRGLVFEGKKITDMTRDELRDVLRKIAFEELEIDGENEDVEVDG